MQIIYINQLQCLKSSAETINTPTPQKKYKRRKENERFVNIHANLNILVALQSTLLQKPLQQSHQLAHQAHLLSRLHFPWKQNKMKSTISNISQGTQDPVVQAKESKISCIIKRYINEKMHLLKYNYARIWLAAINYYNVAD